MNDFGGKLRVAREQRGLTIRQVAATTRISAAVLEALERNDVSKLPGGIFGRAFVRSYAGEVGLDPDETIREFVERFDAEPPASLERMTAVEQAAGFDRRSMAGVLALVLIALAAAALAAAAYFFLLAPAAASSERSPSAGVVSAPGERGNVR